MAEFNALIEAQLSGATVKASPLVLFDFRSGPMPVWGGFGNLVAAGETWQGVPGLSVSAASQGPGLTVGEMEFSLFGSPGLLAHFSEDSAEADGRDVTVSVQFFETRQRNDAGEWVEWQPVDEPLSIFVGTLAPLSVERPESDGQATRILRDRAQDAMINRGRPTLGYFSHQDQQARSPGDMLFSRASQYADATVQWPDFTV